MVFEAIDLVLAPTAGQIGCVACVSRDGHPQRYTPLPCDESSHLLSFGGLTLVLSYHETGIDESGFSLVSSQIRSNIRW